MVCKETMYHYQTLKNISNTTIANCLNRAFQDYALPIQLTKKQLYHLFELNNVDRELSFAAFLESEMIGFIINSKGIYQNTMVLFDVGTGVVPEHRGKQVFTNLFSYACKELHKYPIEKYYLEVLQENHRAIEAYQKQGFTIEREFDVWESTQKFDKNHTYVMHTDMKMFDFTRIDHCHRVEPSYEHTMPLLKRNVDCYGVVYREANLQITAYCIYAKENGRIMQLGYSNIQDLKLIIENLVFHFDEVIAKNIDSRDIRVKDLFRSLGFIQITKQFEMSKAI